MGAYGKGRIDPGLMAVMTLYFFSLGFSIVTPAMARFAEAFPDKEYALINSLPTLFIGIVGLLFGMIAGKRVRFRTLAVLGSSLCLAAGTAPAFISDFYLILVCRALLGVGLGLLIPMANALVNGNYEGDRKAKLLSVGSLMLNAGGIVLQTAGGMLADIGWQYTFYGYLSFAFALAMSFLIPETDVPAGNTSGGLDRRVYPIAALFFVYGIFQFSVMQNTAELFGMRGAGEATVSALALSLFTVAGCAGGSMFSTVRSKRSSSVFVLVWAFSAAGCAVILFTETAVLMTLGLVIFGLGFGLIIPAFVDWTGTVSTHNTVSVATALVISSMYLGDFTSMLWKPLAEALFGEHILSNLGAMVAVSAVFTIVFLAYNPFKVQGGE